MAFKVKSNVYTHTHLKNTDSNRFVSLKCIDCVKHTDDKNQIITARLTKLNCVNHELPHLKSSMCCVRAADAVETTRFENFYRKLHEIRSLKEKSENCLCGKFGIFN